MPDPAQVDIDPNRVIEVQQDLINKIQMEQVILEAAVKGLLAEKYAAMEPAPTTAMEEALAREVKA